MKKLTTLFLAIVLVFSLFSGTTALAETNAERYPLSSDTQFNVVVQNRWNDPNALYSAELWEKVTGVDINFICTDEAEVKIQMAAHDFPDAYLRASGADKATVDEYGQNGYFVNFMEYLDIMPNLKRLMEKYPETTAVMCDINGAMYALPIYGNGPTAQRNVIYIRDDCREKAGWDRIPATTDEFIQCMKDIQAAYSDDPEFIAYQVLAAERMNWDGYMGTQACFFFPSFGELVQTGITTNSEDQVVLGAATEQYKHYLEFMHELWISGAFDTNIYAEDGTEAVARNAANKTGACDANNGWGLDNWNTGSLDVTIIEPLTSKYYNEKHWMQYLNCSWYFTAISTSCKDIETMCKWFDAFYALKDDSLDGEGNTWGISYWLGVEGVDHTVDYEAKQYSILPHEGYASPEDWEAQATMQFSLMGGEFPYTGVITNFLGKKGNGVITNCKPYAQTVSTVSTVPLNEDELDEYNSIWGDIKAYITEMTAKFITGEEDIETGWDTYMKNLNNMGLQDVIRIYTDAYSRSKG